MRTSLYDLSVPTFLQTVRSVGGFLDRAATHFSNTGVDPDNFVNTRLFDEHGTISFSDRSGIASFRVGGRGSQDRRVHPSRLGRTCSLH